MICVHSFHSSQITQCASITNTNELILYREIPAVYCNNHTKHTNILNGRKTEILMLKLMVKILPNTSVRIKHKAMKTYIRDADML